MRWLSLLFAVVFAVAGLKALFVFNPDTSPVSRPLLLVISAAGVVLFLSLFAIASKAKKELSEFETWLHTNRAKVLTSGASYRGTKITGETELTRFLLAASVIILSFKIPSRYYIAGRDNLGRTKAAYSLASLLFGWWGVPWGPIYTIQSLSTNLSGGERMTVRTYLDRQTDG
jgi:hypothetical protein